MKSFSERELSRSYQIGMAHSDQQRLAQGVLDAARSLEESPFIDPAYSAASFQRAQLKPREGSNDDPSFMSFLYSKHGERLSTASVNLADQRHGAKTFEYVPRMDIWANSQPGQESPLRHIGHAALINELAPRLDHNVFEPIMDKAVVNGDEIVQLLAGYMSQQAKTIEEAYRYSTASPIVADSNYTNELKIGLATHKKQNETLHNLSIGSVYETSFGPIRKEYSYSVIMGRKALKSAGGKLLLTSSEEIPSIVLDDFAKQEDTRNAAVALARGIDELQTLTDPSVLLLERTY